MKNKLLSAGLIFASILCLTGCSESKETKYTKENKEQIQSSYGMPQITNYFEYSQLKEIYEKRDDPNLLCYWYTKNDMSGKWVYQGKCIGYGIPYGASITAPTSLQWITKGAGYHELPLSEPNGLYTNGISTSATWILSTDGSGNIEPIYVESEITISQHLLKDCLVEEWSENGQ